MNSSLPVVQTYSAYERQRRATILRALIFPLILTSVVASGIIGFFAITNPSQQLALGATDALLFLVIIILLFGAQALRRNRVDSAITLITLISLVGSSTAVAVLSYFRGFDVFSLVALTPFTVVIVLAGVFGRQRTIVGLTLAINAITLALLMGNHLAHREISNLSQNFWLVLPIVVAYQWLFALLMLVIEGAFRSTLREVSTSFERAQQVDTLKDSFISNVNHELRTPLMAMLTVMTTLRDNDQHLTPEQRHYWLQLACDQGEALSELVKSILSTRRVDQEVAEIKFESVNVRESLDSAIKMMDVREIGRQERDLRIKIEPTVQVWAGQIELRQILTNLLTNAIKYSEPGTPIEISAAPITVNDQSKAVVDRATVEISVRDWGHGIPPDQIPLLFNRFTRLPRDLASQVKGNGLGLYLCRIYAEAMAGTIAVESTGVEGEGSTFRLRLPGSTTARGGA